MSDHVSDMDDQMRRDHGLDVQPRPVNNDLPSAHDLVAEDIRVGMSLGFSVVHAYDNILDHFEDMALMLGKDPKEIIANRKAFGFTKYGTPLQPHNGRKHLEDALDEMADTLVYLRCQMYEEGKTV
ncbi:hypothetical protein SEA_KABOCHA_11 [Gordonia phage Kabocha]|uniref:Uncharacterized protein n=1 Tax=Gordonia phage Chidiebere TaxID=2656530 RepID=A0A649VMI1_9CAUD|nr:hypothetical protein PQD14_gp011 [Gordonia phage Chidiebere]AZS07866.1 hypothetical protein PBI_GRAY_11 [Gordonia phage Gray]QGJ92903.1 hypothetical protein PBI_CHIDIEBERE_11 [Gordonia phage Chidiebere]WAA19798.1 hypothetical protein SEA_KABOCHA_11 [Gordonia phage Kabocha]WAA19989.1 hypothetical protein SEA_HANEM_11 [Gordonia phage Hanem]